MSDDLVIETCHDLINRAMRLERPPASAESLAEAEVLRAKEVALRGLLKRRDELLVTIRNLSASVPYEEEAGSAAVLIAEVGTLKARVAELEREAEQRREHLRFIEHHGFTIVQTALGDLGEFRRKMVWEIVWAARGVVPDWWPLKDVPA